MTEDEVKRIVAEMVKPAQGMDAQTVQWLVRSAYEAGWRAAGGDPASSSHDAPAIGWRASWMGSEQRNILLRNGIITGDEGYK